MQLEASEEQGPAAFELKIDSGAAVLSSKAVRGPAIAGFCLVLADDSNFHCQFTSCLHSWECLSDDVHQCGSTTAVLILSGGPDQSLALSLCAAGVYMLPLSVAAVNCWRTCQHCIEDDDQLQGLSNISIPGANSGWKHFLLHGSSAFPSLMYVYIATDVEYST
jgi:hypothetical protein